MPDFYLQNPDSLKGQPKRIVADYVESASDGKVLVPRRFNSLDEAKGSGLPIIARSEHSDEYAKISGLSCSLDLRPLGKDLTETEIKAKISKRPYMISGYCSIFGLNEQEFIDEISFSLWELLPGYNRTIVADSSVKGMYHIMTQMMFLEKEVFESKYRQFTNYVVVENGQVTKSFLDKIPQIMMDDIPNLISLYETVRTLPRFESDNCPIIEVQTVVKKGIKNYFLQYLRTNVFDLTAFSLEDRETASNEVKSYFVRGATSPEGIDCKVTVVRAASVSNDVGWSLDGNPDQIYIELSGAVFIELMSSRSRVTIISSSNLETVLGDAILGHTCRSSMFKPKISVLYDYTKIPKLIPMGEFKSLKEKAKETKEDQSIDMHVVSDGRIAYIKRLG